MKVKIVDLKEDNFDLIPSPANRNFNCKKCFYWIKKVDGRLDLVKQRRNWFSKKAKVYGSLGKLLLLGENKKPIGFASFGPVEEFKTAEMLYRDNLPIPQGGWCIVCLAIQSPYRGKGLATMMAKKILSDLKKRGVKKVDVYPQKKFDSENQFSLAPAEFWEKLKFEKVGETATAFILRKKLS